METTASPLVAHGRQAGGETRALAPAWVGRYLRTAMALDFIVVLGAGAAAFLLRFATFTPATLPYVVLTLALPGAWLLVLALHRAYEPRLIGIGMEEFRRVLMAGFTITALIVIAAYATKTDIARGYVLLALPAATVGDIATRYWLRKRLHRRRWTGECMRRVVAVGHSVALGELIRTLREKRYHGLKVVGICTPTGPGADRTGTDKVDGVPVLGAFDSVGDVVEAAGAETVVVLTCPEMNGTALRRLAWRLEEDDVELMVAPGLLDIAGPRISIRPVSGLPLLHLDHPELSGGRQFIKSAFDRLAALSLILLLLPVFLVLTVAIRITSRGPAMFTQTRVGRGGHEFTIYKFRTMVPDAEHRKADLAADDEEHVLFKVKDDPRVTPLGRWLRRYSLDELPQIYNVLRGEMSLVGPRPPLPEEVACYGDDVWRRLVVRPGMTGLWQVSGRANLSWEESVRLDLRYVENWSLMLDIQIMWKTFSAVINGSGAY